MHRSITRCKNGIEKEEEEEFIIPNEARSRRGREGFEGFLEQSEEICNSESLRNANGTYEKEKLLSLVLSGDWNGISGFVLFIDYFSLSFYMALEFIDL